MRAFGHGFGEHLVKGQGGGANAEPVQRRLTDYNLAQTEAALRKYMRGYFGAPLYDQSQLESLERELCVDEHQGCHLYYATGDDTHEKLKGYVAAQRRNALRQMELNRAAYEADATRHRSLANCSDNGNLRPVGILRPLISTCSPTATRIT